MLHTPSAHAGRFSRWSWRLSLASNPSPSLLTSGVVPTLGCSEWAQNCGLCKSGLGPGVRWPPEQRHTGLGNVGQGQSRALCTYYQTLTVPLNAEAKSTLNRPVLGPEGPQQALPSTLLIWEKTILFLKNTIFNVYIRFASLQERFEATHKTILSTEPETRKSGWWMEARAQQS